MLLGAPFLAAAGLPRARSVARGGGGVVVNGGNCPYPATNWVHYVHAAFAPVASRTGLRASKFAALHRVSVLTERLALRSARTVIAIRIERGATRSSASASPRIGCGPYTTEWTQQPFVLRAGTSAQRRAGRLTGGVSTPGSRSSVRWETGEKDSTSSTMPGERSARRLRGMRASWSWAPAGSFPSWRERSVRDGLGARITFLGFRNDVPKVLAACDALVAPTRYEAYGAGVHEALCCGLPALVTATAGVAERYPTALRPLLLSWTPTAPGTLSRRCCGGGVTRRPGAPGSRSCRSSCVRAAGTTWRGISRQSASQAPDGRLPVESVSWHIITGEYPPAPGGVADYTRAVARALVAAGDDVHVWAPSVPGGPASDPGVHVHELPHAYTLRGLSGLSRDLRRHAAPRRVLVQYVPHAFGMRAMNVAFCALIASLRDAEVWIMFHEIALPWARLGLWKANAGSRGDPADGEHPGVRARIGSWSRYPPWGPILRAIAPHWSGDAVWLPIPSNVPIVHLGTERASVRSCDCSCRSGATVIGHFGSYGSLITPLLQQVLQRTLEVDGDRVAILVGRGSEKFVRDASVSARVRARMIATGELEASDIAAHLLACDVLVQPYPDGVSSRRNQPDGRARRARDPDSDQRWDPDGAGMARRAAPSSWHRRRIVCRSRSRRFSPIATMPLKWGRRPDGSMCSASRSKGPSPRCGQKRRDDHPFDSPETRSVRASLALRCGTQPERA